MVYGNVGDFNHQHVAVLKLATRTWTLLPDITAPDGIYRPINYGMHMNDQRIGVGISCEGDQATVTNCVGWTWDGKAYSFPNIPGIITNGWEGPYGINDRGDTVGTFEDNNGTHAYLLTDSEFTSIDMPGFSFTQGTDINNREEILLTGTDANGFSQIGIWYKGIFTSLPVPEGAISAVAYGLNDRGDYCGYYVDENGNIHSFVAFRK